MEWNKMNLKRLRSHEIKPIVQEYSDRDTMLYALGLGFGSDPLDPSALPFVYEKGLKALPSMCVVLAHPRLWISDPVLDVQWMKMLHGEQSFELHAPLKAAARVRATYRILGIEDKGAARGAVLYLQKVLEDVDLGERLATLNSTMFLRGDGGQGGFGTTIPAASALPEGKPERHVSIPTLPQTALIYRLSGDYNPIHADPDVARKGGFDRPIMHGLCTMGLACRAVLQAYCDNAVERLVSMFVRFSSPAYPGETIRTEFFRDAAGIRFRARAVERDVVVLDRGLARIAD
jgi:acyl dehydratase